VRRCSRRALALFAVLGLALGCRASDAAPERRSPRELLVQGDRDFDQRRYGAALEAYQLAAFGTRDGRDDVLFASAASQVASVLALQGASDEAASWLRNAEAHAAPTAPDAWLRVLLARGLVAWKRGQGGDNTRALGAFQNLYEFAAQEGAAARVLQACQLATLVTEGAAQLEWARRGITAAAATNEPTWEAAQWSNLGWLLDARGLFEEARQAFERARRLVQGAGVARIVRARTEWAVAHAARRAGALDEAQRALEGLLRDMTDLYTRERTAASAEYLGRVLFDLGLIDLAQGQQGRGRERLQLARARLLEAGASDGAPALMDELEAALAGS